MNIENNNIKDWCRLIAWLINSDNLLLKFTDKIHTEDSCYNSSSRGELSGILISIRFIRTIMEYMSDEECEKWGQIINGKNVEPTKKGAYGFGMFCMGSMWRCSKKFELFTDKVLEISIGKIRIEES